MVMEKPKKETEILSADEEKIRELCGSLKKVEAPKDFDFKLKARIASSKAGDFQTRFGFAFRYALPALALILAIGLLAYNGGLWSSKNNVTMAENSTPNPPAPTNAAASNFTPAEKKEAPNQDVAVLPSNQNSPKVPDREMAVVKPTFEKTRRKTEENPGGGSKPAIGFTAPPVIQLKNIEQIPVKDILSMMGINAAFENGKWIVKSLNTNGIGENSGVKENDVIETIDDKPLPAETIYGKTISVKSLTVTRNGGKSQIKLRGNKITQ
jgi:hypothetical protein